MKKVCVITGGGSGMGFSSTKFIDPAHRLVLTGRTVSKLAGAKEKLESQGHVVETVTCDVSDRESVKELVRVAQALGEVSAVIHAAGVSPSMGMLISSSAQMLSEPSSSMKNLPQLCLLKVASLI